MTDELSRAFQACLARLVELAGSDPQLRTQVERLGHALLAIAGAAKEASPTESDQSTVIQIPVDTSGELPAEVIAQATLPAAPPPGPPVTAADRAADSDQAPGAAGAHVSRPRAPLGRKDGVVVYTTGAEARPAVALPAAPRADLTLIAQRCRLKRQAALWAARRAAAETLGDADDAALSRDLEQLEQAAAALAECRLWMLDETSFENDVPDAWNALAACYDAADAALVLTEATLNAGEACADLVHAALLLTGEAQSALRVAVADVAGHPDPDQDRAFHWLRDFAVAERHFIERYMKLGDPADPANAPELLRRIALLRAEVELRRQSGRDRKRQLSALKYHAGLVLRNPDDDHEHDWRKIVESTDGLVAGGLPPSSVDLRTHLLPIQDMMPELVNLPENMERVLREVDRYLASRPAEEDSAATPAQSPQVQQVASVLRGRTVVLIGGDERRAAREKLEAAFGLERVIWVATSEINTRITFENDIARPEVTLVLLAIRWIRHALNDTRELAAKHNKPLVNLPGGYNPNQVADQILRQRGRDLGLIR